MFMAWPVMYAALSDARNAIRFATSSGVPILPRGVCLLQVSRNSAGNRSSGTVSLSGSGLGSGEPFRDVWLNRSPSPRTNTYLPWLTVTHGRPHPFRGRHYRVSSRFPHLSRRGRRVDESRRGRLNDFGGHALQLGGRVAKPEGHHGVADGSRQASDQKEDPDLPRPNGYGPIA